MKQSIWFLAVFLFAGCATSGDPISPQDVERINWVEGQRPVAKLGDWYFAGQPDDAMLRAAQTAGVDVVINVRGRGEVGEAHAERVRSNGLIYHHVPIERSGPLSAEALSQITKIVEDNPDSQILLHCGSGNRAAAWLATYLTQIKGAEREQALATAKAAGLTSSGLTQRVEHYLDEK